MNDINLMNRIIDIIVLVIWVVVFATMGSMDLPDFLYLLWALIGVAYLFFGSLFVRGILIGAQLNDKEK
jgi:hypothetical protein